MDVYKGFTKIDTNKNVIPTDIEFIGLSTDGYLILKYKIENNMYYKQYSPKYKMLTYLFFEIVNKSPLWNIQFDVTPYNNNWNFSNVCYFNINFSIMVEPSLINDYIKSSLALNHYIIKSFSYKPDFTNTDLSNKSLISYATPVNPPSYFT